MLGEKAWGTVGVPVHPGVFSGVEVRALSRIFQVQTLYTTFSTRFGPLNVALHLTWKSDVRVRSDVEPDLTT